MFNYPPYSFIPLKPSLSFLSSENASLLSLPPWSNPWLLVAIATTMALHMGILYTPAMTGVFGVSALGYAEWRLVVLVSAPIILIDEVTIFDLCVIKETCVCKMLKMYAEDALVVGFLCVLAMANGAESGQMDA